MSNETTTSVSSDELDQLRERYEVERAKRMQARSDESLEIAGAFAHYLTDPFAVSRIERAPVAEDVQVLIVGGGFGGLMSAARHIDVGVTDIRIIDKTSDFGGTWYWNRYPGVACDIESYIYLPLLEELGYTPKEKYSKGHEIFEHCQRIGRSYGLYEKAYFQTEITGMEWSEEASRWIVSTDRGDCIRAQFVCMASGPLQKIKLPNIPGIETFEGTSFHTSRWDYEYTGGDQSGGLENLKDKRVGVIGTGATGIQCIPHLGRYAKQLYVFQRTPSSVDVRGNQVTEPDWATSLKPGWAKARRDNFTKVMAGLDEDVDLVDDGWTRTLSKLLLLASPQQLAAMDQTDLADRLARTNIEIMNRLRDRVDDFVDDPATAELLKPYYKFFCKRPCFHDDYLPTFNRPNVMLVDTNGQGVDSISSHAVHIGGKAYEIDCLILATGFEWGSDTYIKNTGFDIIGRDGTSLGEKWADGAKTLYGIFTNKLPNLYFISHIQAGATPSYTHIADEQAKTAAYITKYCLDHNIAAVETTRENEDQWVSEVEALAGPRLHYDASCTPSYINHGGKIDRRLARNGPHGAGPLAYLETLEKFKSADIPPGLEFQSR